MINIQNLTAASFMPGLQNSGQISGQAIINGTLDASPNYNVTTSNMTGTIFIPLEDPTVISVLRVNLPNASGQLASRWFPLFGTVELTDSVLDWVLIMSVGSASGGRNIYFNFVNTVNNSWTATNFPINIYGHLYSYPF
jgi:hypothetical protein